MESQREKIFGNIMSELNIQFEPEILPGANYVVAQIHANQIYVSGQLPRQNGKLMAEGAVGRDLNLIEARFAAEVSALRIVAILRQALGNLDRLEQLLKLNVVVQSATHFTQQSEIADAASGIFYRIFGAQGTHARTTIGVIQLPKNGAVEIDLLAAIYA